MSCTLLCTHARVCIRKITITLHMWLNLGACVNFVCVCASVCPAAALLSSDAPLSLRSRKIALAVSLADVAGRSPGDWRGETIPTKWHELMWLISTTLIICKLHVWIHITWEAYAACRVRPNKCQLICISGVPHDWRRANQHSAGKRKCEEEGEKQRGREVEWGEEEGGKIRSPNKFHFIWTPSKLFFPSAAICVKFVWLVVWWRVWNLHIKK